VTQEPGRSLRFGGPILHGLSTFNCAAHTILKEFGPSNPANIKEFSARFAAPVRPRYKLVTEIWRSGEYIGEFEDIRFITSVNGKAVLNHGRSLIKPLREE
jgi:acyl dehydratase